MFILVELKKSYPPFGGFSSTLSAYNKLPNIGTCLVIPYFSDSNDFVGNIFALFWLELEHLENLIGIHRYSSVYFTVITITLNQNR